MLISPLTEAGYQDGVRLSALSAMLAHTHTYTHIPVAGAGGMETDAVLFGYGSECIKPSGFKRTSLKKLKIRVMKFS